MKLKRKLGLACALALGTVASVATIGFTTVSCSDDSSSANDNGGSNNQPDNAPNPSYRPSSAIAKKFSLADFDRIHDNSNEYAYYMRSSFESDPHLPLNVVDIDVSCRPILDENIFYFEEKFNFWEQNSDKTEIQLKYHIEIEYGYHLTPNSDGTYTLEKSTRFHGESTSVTQNVSYEDMSQFIGMLYSGNFNHIEIPQLPNTGSQPHN